MAEYAPVDKVRFLETVRDYNAAVQRDIPCNPTVKDGRTTKGLAINKTNWAMPIEKPLRGLLQMPLTISALTAPTDVAALLGDRPFSGKMTNQVVNVGGSAPRQTAPIQ
jgi:hypothetical protein